MLVNYKAQKGVQRDIELYPYRCLDNKKTGVGAPAFFTRVFYIFIYTYGMMFLMFFIRFARRTTTNGVSAIGTTSAIPIQTIQKM